MQAKLKQVQAEIDRIEKARLAALRKKGVSVYDIEGLYSPADKKELDRLRAELDKAITNAGGNIRDYNVTSAQADLASFTVKLGEKYAGVQPKLAHIGGLADTEVKQAMSDYLGATGENPQVYLAGDLSLLTPAQHKKLNKLIDDILDAEATQYA